MAYWVGMFKNTIYYYFSDKMYILLTVTKNKSLYYIRSEGKIFRNQTLPYFEHDSEYYWHQTRTYMIQETLGENFP